MDEDEAAAVRFLEQRAEARIGERLSADVAQEEDALELQLIQRARELLQRFVA